MKERDYFFDNSKFCLVVLVFIGHIINTCRSNEIAKWIYDFIYVFHMPAFMFISGYFSNKSRNPKAKVKNLFRTYILAEIIFILFFKYMFNMEMTINFTEPYWILWFLVSLICLEIISPYFNDGFKSVILAFVISLLAGYFKSINTTFCLSRTIYYLPFFLLGRNFKREYFDTMKKWYIRVPLIILWAIFGIYVWNNLKIFNPNWFYGDLGYKFYNLAFTRGIFFRGITYLISLLSMFAFFSIIPRGKMIISKLGKNTLSVYILHGLLVKYLHITGFFNKFDITNVFLAKVIIATVILSIVMSTNIVSTIFNFILNLDVYVIKAFKKLRNVVVVNN